MTNFRTTKKFGSGSSFGDGYDVYLDRQDNIDELFAADVNSLANSIAETQKALVDGYAYQTLQPVAFSMSADNQAMVYDTGTSKMTKKTVVTTADSGSITSGMIADGTIINADINASAGIDATKIADGSVTSTEFQYLDGVTSSIQTQFGNKANTSTTISTSAPLSGGGDLSASRTLSMPAATTSVDGYLKGADFTTFNNKLNLSGGTMSGAIDMGTTNKITNLAAGSNANDAVTYSQLQAVVSGLIWQASVRDPDLVNDSLSTPPGSPVYSITYIIAGSPTGAWAGLAGYAVWWDGSKWIDISTNAQAVSGQGTAVQVGDRFAVAIGTAGAAAYVGGGLVSKANYIATITNNTPGSIAYTFTAPSAQYAINTSSTGSQHYGSSFTYTGSAWVDFSGPTKVNAGTALSYSGNVLNVDLDSTTINVNGSDQLQIKPLSITDAYISASAGIDASKIGSGTVSNAEFQYLDGVTSSIQTQLGNKANTSTTISTSAPLTGGGDLSASRTLSMPAATTSVDGYLKGTDFTTFNNKAPLASPTFTGTVTASALDVIGNGRGIVPLGSIIAMTSGLTGAMSIPATGVVSNGWMRADGAAIPGSNTVSGTTPNLSSSIFLRGATSYAGTGGANTFTLTTTHLPAHSHGAGTYAASLSGTFASTGHTHTQGSLNAHIGSHTSIGSRFTWNQTGPASASNRGADFAAAKFIDTSGTQGTTAVTGTTDGPSATASLGGSNSVTGSSGITAAASGFDNQPSYIDVIYLIRVN